MNDCEGREKDEKIGHKIALKYNYLKTFGKSSGGTGITSTSLGDPGLGGRQMNQ